ncbi:MAG: hypothetical protein AAFZ52_16585 [Bacteroidota bacterium]
MKNLLFLALLACALFTTGCGGDDDGPGGLLCTSEAYANDIQDEAAAFSNAAIAYGQDQSTANCNAYKDAANAYLDAIKRYETCAEIRDRQDYRDGIRDAEDAIAAITC